MESAMIVSGSEKGVAFFEEMLRALPCAHIVTARSGGEARRTLLDKEFDLILINAPLTDETGESLGKYIASRATCPVILVVKAEHFDAVSAAVEEYGVLTVQKPVSRSVLWSALKLAQSARNQLRRMRRENEQLAQRIEDIRIIDRAKCLLISYLGMSEPEAHKHIEKQAMDMRLTRRAVAEGILKTYED